MGETSNQIKREIRNQRAELGSNLEELEGKVKGLTDWRQQFDKNPLTMIGVAFGGGVLLATAFGGRHSRRRHSSWGGDGYPAAQHERTSQESQKATNHQLRKASDTWDTIKGALIGVAAGKVQGFLKEAIPGFGEEFHKVQRREHPELTSENAPANARG